MPRKNNAHKSSSTLSGEILNPDSLRVSIAGTPVGTLAMTDDHVAVFEYDNEWLQDGFSLNPLSLPLEKKLYMAKRQPFEGLFGVFSDSLPDGWGRLLVDRFLREQGFDPFEISPLGRLAIVGTGGMGALEYEPNFSLPAHTHRFTYDELARECAEMLRTDYSEDLDTLFAMGGSSGGARPKIFTKIDGEDWIVKFPSSHDPADIGLQEFQFSKMAAECGIEMPETRLLPSRECAGYFAIKRFDRIATNEGEAEKIHMASAGALLETTHRVPSLDYDQLLRLTLLLTDDMNEIERLFRLMVFNVAIGNRDDHAKNFSYLYEDGRWKLAPGYDLTRNAGMNGEHATTVNGKGLGITVEDMLDVAKRAGIPLRKAKEIIALVFEITDARF